MLTNSRMRANLIATMEKIADCAESITHGKITTPAQRPRVAP